MRILIIVIAFLLHLDQVSAQESAVKPLPPYDSTSEPLVLVNSFSTSINCLILDPGKIESINVYKDTAAINRFGNAGKNGAVIIHTKNKVNLVRLNVLFDRYQFPDSLRHLRVCINKSLVSRPELILINESEVNDVETFVASKPNDSGLPKDEKFINISTKKNDL